MKKVCILMGVVMALNSCSKENRPGQVEITGEVIHAVNRTPVQGIALSINHYEFLEWWWGYRQWDQCVTNARGEFTLKFESDENILSFKPELNIDDVPSGFQRGARHNGVYGRLLCLGKGIDGLENGRHYILELVPHTKAYFVAPPVPAGWENDTLVLTVHNLLKNPDAMEDACDIDSTVFNFRLSHQEGWEDLKQVRNLHHGDVLMIQYAIKNGELKKWGKFSSKCTIGDTTAVALLLW